MAPATPKKKSSTSSSGGKRLTLGQKILNATASLAGKPNVKVPRKKVAKYCGCGKAESKSYCNALGLLKTKQKHITYDKEFITILDTGFAAADPEAPIGTNDDAIAAAKAKFKAKKQHEIIDICADGQVHTRAEIAERIETDMTKKSFMNLLGPLKTKDYITYVKTAQGEPAVQATEDLLPFSSIHVSSDEEEDEEDEEEDDSADL
jgi:predicted helicase